MALSLRARGVIRVALSAVALAATLLGVLNVVGDNSAVVELAEIEACGSKGCALQKVSEERTPFSQRIGFQLQMNRSSGIVVECSRQFVLLGSYSCQRGSLSR